MFGGLAHEPAYRLAERLAALLPGDLDHVFFAESGSVSVEIAAFRAAPALSPFVAAITATPWPR
jgi:adenosylmethionine-8-amino-7-oxononanoate aminotransferase